VKTRQNQNLLGITRVIFTLLHALVACHWLLSYYTWRHAESISRVLCRITLFRASHRLLPYYTWRHAKIDVLRVLTLRAQYGRRTKPFKLDQIILLSSAESSSQKSYLLDRFIMYELNTKTAWAMDLLVPCIVEGRSELRNVGRVNCKTHWPIFGLRNTLLTERLYRLQTNLSCSHVDCSALGWECFFT
jgi:hypothetical protein